MSEISLRLFAAYEKVLRNGLSYVKITFRWSKLGRRAALVINVVLISTYRSHEVHDTRYTIRAPIIVDEDEDAVWNYYLNIRL